MASVLGFLLSCLSLDALCGLYFFLSPVFLDREERMTANILFAVGYLVTGTIVLLAVSERAAAFWHVVRFRWYSLAVLGLVALCFITIGLNTPEKLLQPGAYFVKYLKVLFPVACFFVMINIWTVRDLPKLYTLLVLMGWVSVVCLIPQVVEYVRNPDDPPRFGSFFLEPNKFALFLNVIYGMTLARMIDGILKGRRDPLLLAANAVLIVVLFMTQSRSGVATWIAVTALCFWPAQARGLLKKSLPILVVVALLFAFSIVNRYLSSSSNALDSDMGRIWTYLVAFNIISQKPLIGIGYANILDYYDQFGPVYKILLGRALGIHNATLEIFAELGVFGAVLYLIVMAVPMVVLARRIRARGSASYPVIEVAALAIPLAFFCFGLIYPAYLSEDYFWAYLAFTIIVMRSGESDGESLRMIGPKWI